MQGFARFGHAQVLRCAVAIEAGDVATRATRRAKLFAPVLLAHDAAITTVLGAPMAHSMHIQPRAKLTKVKINFESQTMSFIQHENLESW